MSPGVTEISADEVKKAMDAGGDFILLDVRTRGEFERSRIEGSVHLPVDEVRGRIASVVPDLNRTIYVYCLSGSRSCVAAEDMQALGYLRVFNMTSGLLAWRSKGFPLVSS